MIKHKYLNHQKKNKNKKIITIIFYNIVINRHRTITHAGTIITHKQNTNLEKAKLLMTKVQNYDIIK